DTCLHLFGSHRSHRISSSLYLSLPLIRPPPSSTLFPYTTLFRSLGYADEQGAGGHRGPMALRAGAGPDRGGGPPRSGPAPARRRSEEHTSELQSRENLVCRLLLEKKKRTHHPTVYLPSLPSRTAR